MIAEVAIREALQEGPMPTEAEMLATIKAAKYPEALQEPTLFERCCDVTERAMGMTPDYITRAVIQTLIDHTPSPRTCDELTRVLGEAGA